MYLADYHLHSSCSPDGGMTISEMAQAAVLAGLQEICITDHVDTVYWADYSPRDDFDWAQLRRQFQEARERWGHKMTLRLGAELGEAHIGFQRAEKLLRDGGELDFVIGSVHTSSAQMGYFDLGELRNRDEAYCKAIMEGYLEENLHLAQWGKFHVLGHLLLPLWYMRRGCGVELREADWYDRIDRILDTLIARGIGLELNAGVCNTMCWAPTEGVLRRYREKGGEIITTGSDAHQPHQVGVGISEAQERLRQAGFHYFTTFEAGRPVFHKL